MDAIEITVQRFDQPRDFDTSSSNIKARVQTDAEEIGTGTKKMLLSLCRIANVPTNRPLSCTDLQAFEETFKLRITVIAASLGNKFIRVPDNTHEDWP